MVKNTIMNKNENKQEAQWARVAHLVFAIYIPLSIYDQRMLHAFRPVIHGEKNVSRFLLHSPI